MNHNRVPIRYPSGKAIAFLTKVLSLSSNWLQDWPLEISDGKRVGEFCDFYERARLDENTRFALMELILFSLEICEEQERWEPRVESLLCQDFVLHLHRVNYWRCVDVSDPAEGFPITPMCRRVWKKCFKREYVRWYDKELDEW